MDKREKPDKMIIAYKEPAFQNEEKGKPAEKSFL